MSDNELAAQSPDHFFTTREVAEILGVSLRTVQVWVDNGQLDAWKTAGGHRRITRASVDRVRHSSMQALGAGDLLTDQIFLARQPILDRLQRITGYELLYRRDWEMLASIGDAGQATAEVLAYAFSDLGMGLALGNHICHINLPVSMLGDDILQVLPAKQVVLEIDSREEFDQECLALCQELKQQGFRIALDHLSGEVIPDESSLAMANFLKLDASQGTPTQWMQLVSRLRGSTTAQLIAHRVEDGATQKLCSDLDFDLFQGYYFARPHLTTSKRIAPEHRALFTVLRLIMSDASNQEIAAAFKPHPSLCYSLLRLVNSASMGLSRNVGTMSDAINILGRRNLQRWAHLLMFAQQGNVPYPSPLMQMAAMRGRLMEVLASYLYPDKINFHDRAFMTGVLSLLDVMLEVSMPSVLNEIGVAEDIHKAILTYDGDLGKILSLCHAAEDTSDKRAISAVQQLGFDMHILMTAQKEAMHWASLIGTTAFQ